MAIEHSVLPDHNLVILKHVGNIPDDEFLNFYKKFFTSDAVDLPMNLLVDLRKADSTPRSHKALHQFAEFMSSSLSVNQASIKVAVIAPDDLSFGLARMYEAYADIVPWDFVVFRFLDAALAWLGLPENLLDS